MTHILSVNVDEVGKNIPDIVPFLERNNINCLEIRTIDDKNVAMFQEADIQKIKAQVERYKYSITTIASPLFKWYSQEPEKIRPYDSFNFPCILSESEKRLAVDNIIATAQAFDCSKVRIFSNLINDKSSMEEIFNDKIFRYCVQQGKQKGINILIENEPVCTVQTIQDIRRLLSEVNDLGLWLDVANFYQIGEQLSIRDLDNLLPKIQHVHLKDIIVNSSQIRYVALGEGDVPWRSILSYFFENSCHEISFSIETHVSNNRTHAAEKSIAFYRSIEELFL
jgi:L-ribulose-5-phosphate 3-epimerase